MDRSLLTGGLPKPSPAVGARLCEPQQGWSPAESRRFRASAIAGVAAGRRPALPSIWATRRYVGCHFFYGLLRGTVPTRARMKLPALLTGFFGAPLLTRRRIALALTVAVVADGIQLLVGPLGWIGIDQVVDVAAMIITTRLLGFHMLLLPTFVIEFIPIASEFLPTWIGCVAIVIALRKKEQNFNAAQVPPQIPAGHNAEPSPSPAKPPIINL